MDQIHVANVWSYKELAAYCKGFADALAKIENAISALKSGEDFHKPCAACDGDQVATKQTSSLDPATGH